MSCERVMSQKDFDLVKKVLDQIIKDLEIPFFVAKNYTDNEIEMKMIDVFTELIGQIDYEIMPMIKKKYNFIVEK